jgi:hypothetical protein
VVVRELPISCTSAARPSRRRSEAGARLLAELVNNAGIFITKRFTDYTPMHRETPKDVMESLSPMGRPSTVKDITDAVMYLTDAGTVTGEILYVDGGAHFGHW